MRLALTLLLSGLLAFSAAAQHRQKGKNQKSKTEVETPEVELRIPDESAPPGGLVQMKLLLTEPTPITTGNVKTHTKLAVRGIEIFNSAGLANGAAVIDGELIQVQYTSTAPIDLAANDYPIMTVALAVDPKAPVGTTSDFAMEPSTNFLVALLGVVFVKPVFPATITVGGSLSITDVLPGGGALKAGTPIRILGTGFAPTTRVTFDDLPVTGAVTVNQNEIQFALPSDAELTGKEILLTNPDGARSTYFSYMRTAVAGQSAKPLLANTIPIFSLQTVTQAVFTGLSTPTADQFSAIALQNPGIDDADVSVSLFASSGEKLGESTVTIAPRTRVVREVSELTGGAAPVPGSYVVISADTPIQTLGLGCDSVAKTAAPISPASFRP
jgi:hypothetical protein